MREQLAELPTFYELLPLFRLPGSRPPDPNGHSATSLARPPLSLDVLDLEDAREKRDSDPQRTDARLDRMGFRWRDRDGKLTGSPAARRQGILPTLVAWCRLVDEELWDSGLEHREYGLMPCSANCTEAPVRARMDNREGPCSAIARQHWTVPTAKAETGFLLLHLDWCGEWRWFGELAADVRTMHADIRQAIGDAAPEPLHCPSCGWGVAEQDGGKWFRCTGCERAWSWLEIGKIYERQKPKTLSEIAVLTHVPLSTLKKWAKLRWIKPVARDGAALYSLVKVQGFALSTQPYRKKAEASK